MKYFPLHSIPCGGVCYAAAGSHFSTRIGLALFSLLSIGEGMDGSMDGWKQRQTLIQTGQQMDGRNRRADLAPLFPFPSLSFLFHSFISFSFSYDFVFLPFTLP